MTRERSSPKTKRVLLTPEERAERKFYTGLRSALRRLWAWYSPARKAALLAAKTSDGWRCAACKKLFKVIDVAVDHVSPCGSLKTVEDIQPFVKRLVVGVDGLQVLCSADHKTKTLAERLARNKEKKCL